MQWPDHFMQGWRNRLQKRHYSPSSALKKEACGLQRKKNCETNWPDASDSSVLAATTTYQLRP
jgi:hypothetical protein